MWKLLPGSGSGASVYPQRECFFCRTTSIVLPPYKPDAGADGAVSNGHVHPSNIASSSTSTISTGTPSNWFCSSCHCQNVANEDGTPVEQYTRPMWDEEWNRDRSQLLRHTRPTSSSDSKLSKAAVLASAPLLNGTLNKDGFRFCHTCQTNQILTVNMLADYLPNEEDPEYQYKLDHLPQYQASIAARYPSVCTDCAPKVQERIAERDQFARSWSLGRWLEIKKKASVADLDAAPERFPRSPLARANNIDRTGPTGVETTNGESRPQTKTLGSLGPYDHGSSFSMILFVLVNTSIWAAYVWTCLKPQVIVSTLNDTAERIKTRPVSLFTAIAAFLSLVCLPWLLMRSCSVEPLKRSIEKARARKIRVQVGGVELWRSIQRLILLVRVSTLVSTVGALFRPDALTDALQWVQTDSHKEAAELLWLAAATLLALEISLTAFATSQLKIRSPTPLQLVSKPVVANGIHDPLADVGADPLLTSLSLDEQALGSRSASKQANGLDIHPEGFQPDKGFEPPVIRDADGDAVMEDAQVYSARRMSTGSDEGWEQTSLRLAPQPQWIKAPHSFGLPPSTSTVPAPPQRPSAYRDFQLGPQRFWEPQASTGLEDVFGRAVSLDDAPQRNADETSANGKWSKWFGFSK